MFEIPVDSVTRDLTAPQIDLVLKIVIKDNKKLYDKKQKLEDYKIGSVVFTTLTSGDNHYQSRKFLDAYQGPFVIHEVLPHSHFRLKKLDGTILPKKYITIE